MEVPCTGASTQSSQCCRHGADAVPGVQEAMLQHLLMHHDGLACCARALTTDAVRPAAEEERPEVYTARGRKAATYLSSCDLAQEGSPTIATLMSPRRLMPCHAQPRVGRSSASPVVTTRQLFQV